MKQSDLFKIISTTSRSKNPKIYAKSSHPSFRLSVQNVKYRVQRYILLHTLLSERYSRLMLFKDTGSVLKQSTSKGNLQLHFKRVNGHT